MSKMEMEMARRADEMARILERIELALAICGPGNSKTQLLGQIGYARGEVRAAVRQVTRWTEEPTR
jgi:hypothetical protein